MPQAFYPWPFFSISSFLCLSLCLEYHMLRTCRFLRGLMLSATNSTILSHSTCTYARGLSTQHLSHIEMTRSILVRELHRGRNGIGREYCLETFWQQKVPFDFLRRNSTELLNNFSLKFSNNFFLIENYFLKINATHFHLRLRNWIRLIVYWKASLNGSESLL